MKGGKKLSKNNAANRGDSAAKRLYEGKVVLPIKLVSGNTTIIAAKFAEDGKLVKDKAGNPVHYSMIT